MTEQMLPPPPIDNNGVIPSAAPEAGAFAPAALPPATPPATGPAPVRLAGWPGVPLTSVTWGWRSALGIAFLAVTMNGLLASLAAMPAVRKFIRSAVASLPVADRSAGLWVGILVVSLVSYAAFLAAAFVGVKLKHAKLAPALGLRRGRLWPCIGLVVAGVWIGFGVDIAFSITTVALKLHVPDTNAQLLIRGGKSPLGLVVVFLLVAVIAPVAEEILFRGVVFSGLRDSWGEGWAIAVSSVLFGVMHLQPLLMIPTAILGVLLAKTFSATRSLWASIALHSAYNAAIMGFGLLALRATGKM